MIISELFEEPYSSLLGLTAAMKAKVEKIPDAVISLVLVDCCFNEVALSELRKIPSLFSLNIENASFCTPKGCENVSAMQEFSDWVSSSGKVSKFNFHVPQYCPCGEADCEFFAIESNCEIGGLAEVEENEPEEFTDDDPTATSWSLEKENEVAEKLKSFKLKSVRLYDIPSGSLGRILASVLGTNNEIIELDCSNIDLGSAVISVEGIELVVSALEANPSSSLARLLLMDGLEGPTISSELQQRMYTVLCRNAWRLRDEPLSAACSITTNVEATGTDGYVDDYARGIVEQAIADNAARATPENTV